MSSLFSRFVALVICWMPALLAPCLRAQTNADLSLQVEATQLNTHSGVLRVVINNLGPDDLVLVPPTLPNRAMRFGATILHFRDPIEPYWTLTEVIEGGSACFIFGFFFGSPPPGGELPGFLSVTGPVMGSGEQRICTFRYEINQRLGNEPVDALFLLSGVVGNLDPDLSNNRQTVTLRGTAPIAIPVNRGIGVLLPLLMLIGGMALHRRRRALSPS